MVIVFKSGNILKFDLSAVEIYVTIGLLVIEQDDTFHEYSFDDISCIVPITKLNEQ